MRKLWTLRVKLAALLILPLLVLTWTNAESLSKLTETRDTMRTALYDTAYKSAVLTLNADRDMYQSMMGLLVLASLEPGTDTYEAQNKVYRENIKEASDHVTEALAVLEANKDQLAKGVSFDDMRAHVDGFRSKLEEWDRGTAQQAGAYSKLRGSQRQGLTIEIVKLNKPFEAAQEELNQLEQLVVDNSQKKLAEIDDTVARIRLELLLTGGLSILLMLALGTLLVRNIQRSLSAIAKVSHAVAEGDLTVAPVDVRSEDEIGRLGQSVNRMLTVLREFMSSSQDTALQLASSSEELTAGADQSAKASQHIAGHIGEVAAGAGAQSTASDTGLQLVDRMAVGLQGLAQHTAVLREAAVHTSSLTDAGSRTVQDVVSKMESIHASVDQLSVGIRRLGTHSAAIEGIVQLIADISRQTNLLSLNAAIEASRAGEHGRGFAVVAQEVRKLAEQSAQSAGRIAGLVESIAGETRDAVKDTERVQQEIARGLEAVQEADATFLRIREAGVQVEERVQQAAVIADELSTNSSEVQELVGGIAQVAQQAAGETESIAAASEEQLATLEDIYHSARELSRVADDMQLQLARFKL